MRRAFAGVLLGLLGVSPASAQLPSSTAPQPLAQQPSDQPGGQPMTQQAPTGKPDDPTKLDPVVVTVTRTEQKAADAPASVTVLTREDISLSPSVTLDDLLRQVPGFSLFRRSSSLVTHPTTQGLSLRGIGPSGTSRALVLVDGIPANDAFGGWVYWDRISLQGIDQIEVVRAQPRATSSDKIEFVRTQPRSIGEPQVVSAGFDWKDAGIGAGLVLALVLLGGGAALATRRLGREQTA